MLGDALDGNNNSLNALRLMMAVLVIVAHSWWLTGLGPGPAVAGGQLGSWAVVVFFGISGYLITRSRLTATPARFFLARFLRIMPGLAACLLVVAFIFAPLSAALGRRTYDAGAAAEYVVRHISLIGTQLGETPIGDTLSGVTGADRWNSPLWTLFWEVFCYLIVGLLAFTKRELFRAAVVLLFVASTVCLVLQVFAHGSSGDVWTPILAPMTTFLAGSLLFLFRDHVSAGHAAVWMALGTLAVSFMAGNFIAFCHLPLAYLIIRFGASPVLHRVGSKFDISYGMYIYGWPVQQLLVLAGLHTVVPLGVFALVSVAATAPVAWLSFVLVERPAQRLGKRRSAKPDGIPPVVVPA